MTIDNKFHEPPKAFIRPSLTGLITAGVYMDNMFGGDGSNRIAKASTNLQGDFENLTEMALGIASLGVDLAVGPAIFFYFGYKGMQVALDYNNMRRDLYGVRQELQQMKEPKDVDSE